MTTETKKIVKTKTIVDDNSLYTTEKDIDAAIAKGVKKEISLRLELQRVACSVILHVGKSGDIRVMRSFLESMKDSSLNTNSMKEFFVKYASVYVDNEGEFHYTKDKPTQLGYALERAWWKARPLPSFVAFDLDKEIARVYERAIKIMEDETRQGKGDNVSIEKLQVLESLIVPTVSEESANDENAVEQAA